MKIVGAHRIAYILHHDIALADIDGLDILHSCDNPPCVNPAHLLLGTQKTNTRDMANKGRAWWQATNARNNHGLHKPHDIPGTESVKIVSG